MEGFVTNFIQVIFIFLRMFGQFLIGPIISILDTILNTLNINNFLYLFTDLLEDYIGPMVGFFFQFMGPNTISVILLELGVYMSFYALMLATTWIIKMLNVIKKLPLA